MDLMAIFLHLLDRCRHFFGIRQLKFIFEIFSKRNTLISLLFLFSIQVSYSNQCLELFNGKLPTPRPAILSAAEVIATFEFPVEYEMQTTNKLLRRAIYEAFNGKDLYTGRDIEFSEMSIDHIVASSLGGPNNIYNYIPTTREMNSRKNASFDALAAIPLLGIVRTVYAPKVIEIYNRLKRQEQVQSPPAQERTSSPVEGKRTVKEKRPAKEKDKSIKSSFAFLDVRNFSGEQISVILKIFEFYVENGRQPNVVVSGENATILRNTVNSIVVSTVPLVVWRKSSGNQQEIGFTRLIGSYHFAENRSTGEAKLILNLTDDLISIFSNYDKQGILELFKMGLIYVP